MKKQPLEVFVRVKPGYEKQKTQYTSNGKTLNLEVGRNKLSNTKDKHAYNFNRVFTEETSQAQMFDSVAKPVIDNCLDGYNGTIFAYGQTGSGKTYTMSGGDKWLERGIIPRVISYVYEQFKKRSKHFEYSLGVTFIQIYNQNAYDLLEQKHSQHNFESWSKIVFMEDQDSNLQMKNAETHYCESQQKTIQYLMMGNYLRKINSTSLNQESSRSHCIFTLNICGKNKSSLVEFYSKVNLVDLAGSERVSKSQAEGLILTEAKSINLSLTYLEQVIVALNQKSKTKTKQHIPYRNSLLTTLLKDSLGGNCKTVMIATVSVQNSNIDETVSTLRFGQRVKQIQNQITKNQKNIYSSQIDSLQKQNTMLRKKLQEYQKQNWKPDINKCKMNRSQEQLTRNIECFMRNKNKSLQVGSVLEAQFCFVAMRDIYNKKMREYATELTFISQKLQRYDQILSKRQNTRRGPNGDVSIQ